MFASRHTKILTLPFEPSHTVTIRKLPGKDYTQAIFLYQTGHPGDSDALVVRSGLVSWTLGDLTPERLEDLDHEAVQFLAEEILRLTKPGMFLTAHAAAADEKNDERPSTAA